MMEKQKLILVEQQKRSNYNQNEIFFKLCNILTQSRFSKIYYITIINANKQQIFTIRLLKTDVF